MHRTGSWQDAPAGRRPQGPASLAHCRDSDLGPYRSTTVLGTEKCYCSLARAKIAQNGLSCNKSFQHRAQANAYAGRRLSRA